jgi:hypothetical protein
VNVSSAERQWPAWWAIRCTSRCEKPRVLTKGFGRNGPGLIRVGL